MISEKKLNANGNQLCKKLAAARAEQGVEYKGRTVNVAGVGSLVSTAYEQLRNAAEYAQEHLLIRKRHSTLFSRSVSFHNHVKVGKNTAEELIIELTQAGYLKNNTQPIEIIDKLGEVISNHYYNYWRLKSSGVDEQTARGWTLDLLAMESEEMPMNDDVQSIYLEFAYHHYKAIINEKSFKVKKSSASDESFDVSLYIAVHRSLFKSGPANVRFDMQKLYKTSDKDINEYAQFHKNIDACSLRK